MEFVQAHLVLVLIVAGFMGGMGYGLVKSTFNKNKGTSGQPVFKKVQRQNITKNDDNSHLDMWPSMGNFARQKLFKDED